MKTVIFTLLLLIGSTGLLAQTEEDAVRKTLQNYIDGTSYNNPEQIEDAFYKDAHLFLSKDGQEIFIMTAEEYADSFKKREQGTFNGREGKILSVDVENDIATAKAEILIPEADLRFIDIFLLKKLSGTWKIISKAATMATEE